uniref:K Homology domain-containing protein n=1 Tax=Panagrolaimus sp. ES5 TaxID=591445 RepID=A0AC34GSK7_9BILA
MKRTSNSCYKGIKDFPSTFLNKCDFQENDKFKQAESNNNSTLSLHIAAYENSMEDSTESGEEEGIKKQVDKSMIKKWKSGKNFFTGSVNIIQNPFELPRQQESIKKEPEIMQFKASQKLLNPNDSTIDFQKVPAENTEQHLQQSENAVKTTPISGSRIPPGCIQRILSIPGTKCGLIIGRNGNTIKTLQETLGVKMLLMQENHTISLGQKPLRITGTPDKVENACRTIENIINSEDVRPQYAKSVSEVNVPRSLVGIIIGKSGETIERLINESGCKIQFKPDEDPNTPDRCVTFQGTSDQIARGNQMISDLIQRSRNYCVTETFLMNVPANKTGLVIGKGGDTIKQICGESGAHVNLSRDPPPNSSEKVFVIKGTSYQIHHAQHIIRIKVGEIPPGTPFADFTGLNSVASAIPPATSSYAFDGGYDQWKLSGAYTAAQRGASSNCYQQQQQQQPHGANAVYGHTGTAAPTSTEQQSAGAQVQDYSTQWAEYYRQMGMHEKAVLVEEHRKKHQASTSRQTRYGTGPYN